VEAAGAERGLARAQVLASRSRAFPQFSLFAQRGFGNNQPIDQIRDDQVGISADWELFSFGQRGAVIDAAQETLRAAKAGELQAQTEVAQRAILLYYELLRTERMTALTESQTEGYGREAETVGRRLERGLMTRSDARQIEARYAAALARGEEIAARRDQVAIALSVFTGLEIECVETPSAERLSERMEAFLAQLTPAQALVMAEDHAFAINRARAQVRAAEARLRGARRAALPTLSLNAFVLAEYDDSDLPIDDRWEQDDRVGLSLRGPLFTGGRLRAGRAEQRARLRGAEATLAEQRRELESAVRTAVLGVQRQAAIQARRRAAAEAANDRLDATSTELGRGTKTITEFVLANEDYFAAAVDEVAAAWARDQQLVSLAALTGMLLEVNPVEAAPSDRIAASVTLD
jgi:outer membrane protein